MNGTSVMITSAALGSGTAYLFTHRRDRDLRLANRIRVQLARHTAHPNAIRVDVRGDVATLYGAVLSRDVAGVVGAVRGLKGVGRVEDRLDVRREPGDEPSLQNPPPDAGPSRSRRARKRSALKAAAGIAIVCAAGLWIFSRKHR